MIDPGCKYDVPASHRDDLLDEALDETFPASDPIALTPPTDDCKGGKTNKPTGE